MTGAKKTNSDLNRVTVSGLALVNGQLNILLEAISKLPAGARVQMRK